MSNRTAKFASAILASFLAGTPLTTVSSGAAPADTAAATADSCVSAPKGQPAAGGHWYYRIDRATKRHCWYVGDGKQKLAHATPVASPSKNTISQGSIADAHAELSPQADVGQDTGVVTRPQAAATAPGMDSANTADADLSTSLVASRWPGQSDLTSSARPGPASAQLAANTGSGPAATSASIGAAVPLTAADSVPQRQSDSVQMLVIVVAGALALAGLIASAIFRFGNRRRIGRNEIRGQRPIWDSNVAEAPTYRNPDPRLRRVETPAEPRAADDPDRRIAEMLARLSRSAAT